jgi:hypothetical protein
MGLTLTRKPEARANVDESKPSHAASAKPAGAPLMPLFLREANGQARAARGPAPTPAAHRDSPPAASAPLDDPLAIAARGVSQAFEPLPHFDRVQQAFGQHDISGVRAGSGADASDAASALGARAFTLGERIAFRAPPDLHLVAHEAAHVIQQRAGVQLDGGVGHATDRYERHADTVADAVVQGRSAEPLLGDAGLGRGRVEASPGSGPQLACECGGTCSSCAAAARQTRQLQFDLDPEIVREREEERDAAVGPLRIDFESQWDLGASVRGPLEPGTVVDDHGLLITQHDAQRVTFELGDRRIEIAARPDERYVFWVEPLLLPAARSGIGGGEGLDGFVFQLPGPQPLVQRVVRIAATLGVRIDAPWYRDETEPPGRAPSDIGYDSVSAPPELVAHVRWSSPDHVNPWSEGTVGAWVTEMLLDGGAMQLTLDDTRIRMSPPGSERGFEGGDFVTPRFAYWLDPYWTGADRNEKIVYIVASPGIRVELGEPPYHHAVRHYGRKLVPVVLRVPHPSQVPEQGTEINPNDYIGDQPLRATEPGLSLFGGVGSEPPSVRAVAGLSGGVTIAHESGAMISIRPVDVDRGAAFAYQAIPDDNYSVTEVRIVVGPGVFVEVVEPYTAEGVPESFQDAGEGFRRAGFEFQIVEVYSAELVPPQGTPLNMYHYLGYGRERAPDNHRWMENSTLGYDVLTSVVEGAIGFIPIVGDLADFAHFGYALATGRDVWGHELTTTDQIVMGIGAVIGLIPIIGDLAKMGLRAAARGSRIALDVASAAARLGTTPEIAEVLAHRLSRAAPGADADAVSRVNAAFRTGADIDADDIERVAGVLRRLGAGEELLGASRFGRQTGLLVVGEADDAARLGRRAPEVDNWYSGLNRETRELLHADPALARAYENMDAGVRRLLTRCGSACIPHPPPTAAQQARILAFAQNTALEPGSLAERRVRTFLQLRRADLDVAITSLERHQTPARLARFLGREVADADVVLLRWPGLRARGATRTAVDNAIAAGVDVEQLAKIMDATRDAGLAGGRMLDYVTELGKLRRAGITGVDEVLGDLAKGGNWARGAEWMLRYCDSQGWRGITKFEFPETTTFGSLREVDVFFGDVRYQFKSWSNFYPSTFVKQFEKDFDLVAGDLSKLRWAFDPRKALKDPDFIRAAAEQALDDALARGTTRLTAAEIGDIKLALPGIIMVP